MIFPFRPGDWVVNGGDQVAKVRGVWKGHPGEVLLDLVIFSHRGDRVGRVSPACGGPRTFEPACSGEGWTRVSEPRFPISYKWIDDGSGRMVARLWAGEPLPPAQWRKPERRRARIVRIPPSDDFRRALEFIAAGHNDARGLAAAVLAAEPKS